MEKIETNENNCLRKINTVSTIAFISDLHFDFTGGRYCEEQSEQHKNDFISFVKGHYANSVLCIVGDCYNNYKKTMNFIEELEQERITGFYVLGNHDYWNEGLKSYDEIIRMFEDQTKNYKYFRLLTCGRKFYMGGICFIGDTGWTSFRRKGKLVDIETFSSLPESCNIKNFSCEEIIEKHNKWIEYANKIIQKEKKIVILTHFPMVNFSRKPKDCWWSSETQLIESKNYWNIFGHTHKESQRKNHVSAQIGYNYFDNDMGDSQYCIEAFGMLVRNNDFSGSTGIDISRNTLQQFYAPARVMETDINTIKSIKRRGYRRCSCNKEILAYLATKPNEYLQEVKEIIKGYEEDIFIDYKLVMGLSDRVIQAVHAAITVLERNFEEKDFSNPKEFIIAAVITGYVYNEMPELIDDRMRPVDDYDVIRLYLMLLTMKQYGIEGDEVLEIRGHASRYISVGNIRINLPVVNKHCMTVDEVLVHFRTAGISSIGQIQIQIPEKSKGKKKIYTDRNTVYETKKLRDLKSDVFSFLKFKEGNVEEIRERLEELRNINEEKYAALEKKYSKHDIEQKLF